MHPSTHKPKCQHVSTQDEQTSVLWLLWPVGDHIDQAPVETMNTDYWAPHPPLLNASHHCQRFKWATNPAQRCWKQQCGWCKDMTLLLLAAESTWTSMEVIQEWWGDQYADTGLSPCHRRCWLSTFFPIILLTFIFHCPHPFIRFLFSELTRGCQRSNVLLLF